MLRISMLLSLLVAAVVPSPAAAAQLNLSRAQIVVLDSESKILANAGDMLKDEITHRTRLRLDVVSKVPDAGTIAIVIGTGKHLVDASYEPPAGAVVPAKADAYSIWIDTEKRKSATVCIAGHDERGALFGVGMLLRMMPMGRDELSLDGATNLATAPEFTLRGHQMGTRPKTHSYDAYTVDMWEQNFRDLIIFGCNAIEIIPIHTDDDDDSPHFPLPHMELMAEQSRLCDAYGLDVWIWFPAMEDDYKGDELDEALEEWEGVFKKLPRIDVVFVPGGDPGGTSPKDLFRFMEAAKKVLVRHHPKGQIWMSPQGFDWKKRKRMGEFYDLMKKEPRWLDGIVYGPQIKASLPTIRENVPARYPIRRYPDITHVRGSQYSIDRYHEWDKYISRTLNREPINPRPRDYAKIFRDVDDYSMGFITYSEGCNDDVNKCVWSCLGWDPEMKVEEILRQYGKVYISDRMAEEFAQGLLGLEQNLYGDLATNPSIAKTVKLFEAMEKRATPQDKLNWRFQMALYRAYYDAYIQARLRVETKLVSVIKNAKENGADKTIDEVDAILVDFFFTSPASMWRRRVYELAEGLYQSIRMQLSVDKYKAIRENRGATLDGIDKKFLLETEIHNVPKILSDARKKSSEEDRLKALGSIAQ